MQAITLEVILRTVFGISDARRLEELGAPLRRILDSLGSAAWLLALQFTSSQNPRPRTPWGRVKALRAAADRILLDEISARRATGDEDDSILSLLLAARDEDDQPLTDDELRDELMTLLVAGHETTATALAWTLERLVRHPDVLARLYEEHAAGGDAGGEYLDAVIKETLRLRPVVPAVVRLLRAPVELGGWELPEGVHIGPSIYLLHRRPDIYPSPDEFRPERFLERPAGTYEWIPFGGGIRRCLGASFALYEMRVVLQTILDRVQLSASADAPERIVRRAVTFTPSDGGRVVAAPVSAARHAAPAVGARAGG
jgi:cytochrome P450